jgi:GTP-binding protein HflX
VQKVILVDIIDPRSPIEESVVRMDELENLVNTYGGFVIIRKIQRRQIPDYRMFIGKGKVQEIYDQAAEAGVSLVIINNLLKPQQLYNLEEKFEKSGIKVWDRIDLILKIFAKHAVTKEARLQIELAGLKHLGPRIFKMGADLMRQGGGIGTRGVGETNIEIMKRHIAREERRIKDDLKKLELNRQNQRQERRNQGFKTVAIVGYANAGKSELLRSLTKKQVKVKDELFATLDSRIGKLWLPDLQKECLVSDTIGFIRDLPPELIEAFHATLEETINADLILHVIDLTDKEIEMKIDVVNVVLGKLGCGDKKMIYVFNKIDLLGKLPGKAFINRYKKYSPVMISAKEKTNFDELKKIIAKNL